MKVSDKDIGFSFKPNVEKGAMNTKWIAGVAALLAPVYMYIVEGERSITSLAVFSALGILLSFILYGIRYWVGGIDALTIFENRVELHKKNKIVSMRWEELVSADFVSVNSIPWLTLTANNTNHRICLEAFTQEEREQIFELITGEAPDKTKVISSWTIGNRIPFSYKTTKPNA
ncbi:MAG: hypothetical protein R8M14_04535 [Ghiorsea sp.]